MNRKEIEDRARILVDKVMTDKKIGTLANKMRTYDKVLFNHCMNVAFIMAQICYLNKFPKSERFNLTAAALLHDVGKLNIPQNILQKDGNLEMEEFQIMKDHVSEGVSLLRKYEISEEIVKIIACHHERLDGSGYPHGYTRFEIPEASKLLAAVDAYDALTAVRPYGKVYTDRDALCIMEGEGLHELRHINFIKECPAI